LLKGNPMTFFTEPIPSLMEHRKLPATLAVAFFVADGGDAVEGAQA
jgi:hypothetical protein